MSRLIALLFPPQAAISRTITLESHCDEANARAARVEHAHALLDAEVRRRRDVSAVELRRVCVPVCV